MRPSHALVAGLGAWLLLRSCLPALGFSQAPLTLAQSKGAIQISNTAERSIELNLQVFPVVHQDGKSSAALVPLPTEQAEQVIRLRPTQMRLAPGATRTIPYTVLDPSRDFFLCGVSAQGLFMLRVCSRWRPALAVSLSAPAAQR